MAKKRKKKRRIQLVINIFVCVGICMILSAKFGIKLLAENERTDIVETKQANVEVSENMISKVKLILQNPELPTGCEATAGTMLLNAYGYDVEKMEVAQLLEKGERIEKKGVLYAIHPNEAFIGDPETIYGYGTFPNVLAKAMQGIIDMQDGKHKAKPLYGETEEDILKRIDMGIPVCIWSSRDDMEIEYRRGWYLIQNGQYTDEYFYWPSNEHVLVLTGYDEKNVTVFDPLVGNCQYPRESFFRHYEQVGKYALVIE